MLNETSPRYSSQDVEEKNEESMEKFEYNPQLAERRRRHFEQQKRLHDINPDAYIGNVQHGQNPLVLPSLREDLYLSLKFWKSQPVMKYLSVLHRSVRQRQPFVVRFK